MADVDCHLRRVRPRNQVGGTEEVHELLSRNPGATADNLVLHHRDVATRPPNAVAPSRRNTNASSPSARRLGVCVERSGFSCFIKASWLQARAQLTAAREHECGGLQGLKSRF